MDDDAGGKSTSSATRKADFHGRNSPSWLEPRSQKITDTFRNRVLLLVVLAIDQRRISITINSKRSVNNRRRLKTIPSPLSRLAPRARVGFAFEFVNEGCCLA